MSELDHIVILTAAMIAQGRPYFSEANMRTLTKQARQAREQIRVALIDAQFPDEPNGSMDAVAGNQRQAPAGT